MHGPSTVTSPVRYDRHAVFEIRRCIDLVRYRFFGADLLGLEPVVTAARDRGPGAGSRRDGRVPKAQLAEGGICELRDALDEVLVSLGEDVRRIERKQYRGLGHHGTGDLEVRLRTEKDLERAGQLPRVRGQGPGSGPEQLVRGGMPVGDIGRIRSARPPRR